MGPNETSPLSPLAQEALDALASTIPPGDEFTYEQAYAILKEKKTSSGLLPKISSNGCTIRAIFTKSRENSDSRICSM